MTDPDAGRTRRPRGGWETEHLDDLADDAERHAEAPGRERLTLLSTTAVAAVAGWRGGLDEIVLTFDAVDTFGAAVTIEVVLCLPIDVAAELVGDLTAAVIDGAEHDPPNTPH